METEILLVDDDLVTISLHKTILKIGKIPSKIRTFVDGKEVMDFVEESANKDTHYIFLLDINMPRLNGFGVLDSLEKFRGQLNFDVIMVSSSMCSNDKLNSLSYDFVVDFIIKPFRITDLSKIKWLIQNREEPVKNHTYFNEQ